MSHNEPLHLEPPIAMGCADEQRPRYRCCKCTRDCTLVDNAQWSALQESACCRTAFYRVDMDEEAA